MCSKPKYSQKGTVVGRMQMAKEARQAAKGRLSQLLASQHSIGHDDLLSGPSSAHTVHDSVIELSSIREPLDTFPGSIGNRAYFAHALVYDDVLLTHHNRLGYRWWGQRKVDQRNCRQHSLW